MRRRRTQFGNARVGRGRVLETRLIDLTIKPFEPRRAIDAIVEVRGVTLRVIATPLGLSRRDRRRQLSRLAELLQQEQPPLTIVLRDLILFGPERSVLPNIGAPMPVTTLGSFP